MLFIFFIKVFLNIALLNLVYLQITNIIVLPFKTFKINFSGDKFDIIDIVENRIYTDIKVDDQYLTFFYKSTLYGTLLNNDTCFGLSNYVPSKSKSFNKLIDQGNGNIFASEVFQLYRDIELKNIFPGLFTKIHIINYEPDIKLCGIIGLKATSSTYEYSQSIFKTYKLNENVKKIIWTIYYENEDNGKIIIGDYPKNYMKKEIQILSDKTIASEYQINWELKFDISINNNKYKNLYFSFKYDLDVIFVNQVVFEKIEQIYFNNLYSNGICERVWVYQKYCYIKCKNSVKSKLEFFPEILFYNLEMNYTFILDKNNVFKEINNYIYFLIFDNTQKNENILQLGKPFLKNYIFTFDIDNKIISLVLDKNSNSISSSGSGGNYINIIIMIILSVIFLIIGMYIGNKYIIQRIKKKKANELIDDFEYKSNNEAHIEMNSKIGI